MTLPSFTPQEQKAIIFLLVCLVIGGGVSIYKKYHSDFAKELLLGDYSSSKEKANFPFEERNEPLPQTTAKEKGAQKIQSQNIFSDRTGKKSEHLSKTQDLLKNKININTATLEDLELLPYIGPTLSRRIISYREKYGRFKTIEELKKVSGIGEKTFEKIKEYVKVE